MSRGYRGTKHADGIADVVREMAVRLEPGAEVAAGPHGWPGLTGRARSTLADERCQASRGLEEERERRDLWPNGGARTSAWGWGCPGERENPTRAPVLPRPAPAPTEARVATGGPGRGSLAGVAWGVGG